ncbi:hypothetical protein PF005_g25980 [Phytophthora fragariae]|uniref:RxLR effector protein n=1 Tax=Phytophthora fragariae TaxID=53985 RepID=A0A6A3Q857_9STRA|nr:hypothetical protein PF009_g27089 [Phytophthora fragariae]KAE8971330.1 hypothetical protein PF011_g26069 [Phytophthora fragariae]KAE9069737.1 hypothetical protein PF007_g27202 [Phytophthora fragariae]KAE9071118.1 hypothetical protein PF006_g29222 [Phytophthora fragariae]KAE9072035.1 hypothetical protein PF010_g25645 [Phytophthora fragariae]
MTSVHTCCRLILGLARVLLVRSLRLRPLPDQFSQRCPSPLFPSETSLSVRRDGSL